MGHLTRDVEVSYTQKGTAVAEVSIAMNHSYTDAAGQKKEDVTFMDLVFWEKKAELLAQYKKKGDCILVTGRLEQQTWEDKQTGGKRSKLRCVVNTLTFIPRASDNQGGQRQQSQQRPQQQSRQQPSGQNYSYDDDLDDIPF